MVTLATTEGLASRLVQLGLLDLRERYPELVIEILTGNRPAELAHGEADLALRVLPPKESQLRARRLIDMKVALYAAPGYLRDRGLPAAGTSSMATMPWCLAASSGSTRLFELADIPPRQLWLVTAADAAQRAAVRIVAEAVRQLPTSD